MYKIHDATALKSRDRLKQLLQMTVQGALWLSKRLSLTLISVFLTGFRYISYQVPIVLTRQVNPVPEKFQAVRRANHYTKQAVIT